MQGRRLRVTFPIQRDLKLTGDELVAIDDWRLTGIIALHPGSWPYAENKYVS
jgi:hypothetical protein